MAARRSTAGGTPTPSGLAERLAERLLAAPLPPAGVLDPACGDGRLLLAVARLALGRGLAPPLLHGIEVDPDRVRSARERLRRDLGGAVGERAARAVHLGDALTGSDWPPGTAVVANPPWVSYSGRASAGRPPAGARDEAGGWPSLHGAFLARIASHVRDAGTRAAILLPASTCSLAGYGRVRARVTERARLAEPPLELGERSFPGILEPAALVVLEPRPRPGPGSARTWNPDPSAEAELLRALADHPRLPPESFGDIGVHTGNAARRLVERQGRPGLPGLREGRDLVPYRVAPPRLGLDVGVRRTAGRRFRYAPLERYEAVPVLVRQTADRPVAALHTAPTFFRNSLLACWPPEELDPAFVVAVLNSGVAAAWHRLSFADARQRAFPQVKIAHLRALPFPRAGPGTGETRALHDSIAAGARALQERGGDDLRARRRLDDLVRRAYGVPAELAGRALLS